MDDLIHTKEVNLWKARYFALREILEGKMRDADDFENDQGEANHFQWNS